MVEGRRLLMDSHDANWRQLALRYIPYIGNLYYGLRRLEIMGLGQKAGLILGPLLFAFILFFSNPQGLSWEGKAVAASTAWIASWWLTEAVPIPATSLLPIILFPLLGVAEAGKVTAEYGNQIIFLLIGGFFIAIAMEKWRLHTRIALLIVKAIGTSPRRIIAGFMAATAFMSAWITNTATAMMMVPVASAAISHAKADRNFGKALMLSVAYAASIGGVATLIGTPPNLIFAGVYRTFYGKEITFMEWASFGVPLAIFILVACWAYLVYVLHPQGTKGAGEEITDEAAKLGRITPQEKGVLGVFLLVAALWITRAMWNSHLPFITDSSIAIFGAILLFLLPAGNGTLLAWEDAAKLPWGVVILLGGGLAIAKGFTDSGLDGWVAQQLFFLKGMPVIVILLAVITLTVFLTEITSNTATATILLPVSASLASGLGIEPMGMMIATAVAASLAFMLPVATPPNAIVFGTGHITMKEMAHAGLWMNVFSIAIITIFIALRSGAMGGLF